LLIAWRTETVSVSSGWTRVSEAIWLSIQIILSKPAVCSEPGCDILQQSIFSWTTPQCQDRSRDIEKMIPEIDEKKAAWFWIIGCFG
jgi:hypothetical protein